VRSIIAFNSKQGRTLRRSARDARNTRSFVGATSGGPSAQTVRRSFSGVECTTSPCHWSVFFPSILIDWPVKSLPHPLELHKPNKNALEKKCWLNLYIYEYYKTVLYKFSYFLLYFSGDCQPVGLLDVTHCYYGFPISLSFPHFMNGDLGLQQNITGVSPDPVKHSSAFVIQPVCLFFIFYLSTWRKKVK